MGWLYDKFHSLVDKDRDEIQAVRDQLQEQSTRLDGAIDNLNTEVREIKQSRVRVARVLDEALKVIREEFK